VSVNKVPFLKLVYLTRKYNWRGVEERRRSPENLKVTPDDELRRHERKQQGKISILINQEIDTEYNGSPNESSDDVR
jgi:hypothetical protein